MRVLFFIQARTWNHDHRFEASTHVLIEAKRTAVILCCPDVRTISGTGHRRATGGSWEAKIPGTVHELPKTDRVARVA